MSLPNEFEPKISHNRVPKRNSFILNRNARSLDLLFFTSRKNHRRVAD